MKPAKHSPSRARETFRVFLVLRNIVAWMLTNPDRPSIARTLGPLLLLVLAPLVSALSLVLLPTAVLGESVPPVVLEAVQQHFPAILHEVNLAHIWTVALAFTIPGLYVIHAALNYLGRRQLLRLSAEFQQALAKRVAHLYRAGILEGGAALIGAPFARRLIMSDARYISRAYLTLAAAVPALLTAAIALAILLVLVPWILLSLIMVLLLFAPMQGIVAAEGQRFSSAFLNQAGKYGSFLTRALTAFSMLPFPSRLGASKLSEILIEDNGKGYFSSFRERTRVGYFGEFSTGLTVASMLLMLILAFRLFPEPITEFSAEKIVLTLVSARHFLSGITIATQAIVGLGATYPYCQEYVSVVSWQQPNVELDDPDSSEEIDRSRAASSGTKASEILISAGDASIGLAFAGHDNVWKLLDRIPICYRTADGSSSILPPASVLRICLREECEWPSAQGLDLNQLRQRFSDLHKLWDELGESLQGSYETSLSQGRRRTIFLSCLATALSSEEIRVVFIGQAGFRLFQQTERVRLARALNSCGLTLVLVNDDATPFILPEPTRFFILDPDAGIVRADLAQANDAAFGAKINELALPQSKFLGVAAESPCLNWKALAAALDDECARKDRPVVLAAWPIGADAFLTIRRVMGAEETSGSNELGEWYPGLSRWWEQLDQCLQTRRECGECGHLSEASSPSNEFVLGLAAGLLRHPANILVPHSAYADLDPVERRRLIDGLSPSGTRLILWNCDGTVFEQPAPEQVLHLRSSGDHFRTYPGAEATAAFLSEPATRQSVTFRFPNGELRNLAVQGQIGILANQPNLSWNEIRHFRRVARDATTFFDRESTLIAVTLLDVEAPLALIAPELASVDVTALQAGYPALGREWAELSAYVIAFRENKPLAEAQLADVSPATRFWMAAAIALSGESDLLFVRERDLRLIPQKARSRLINSLGGRVLVVWKDNLSMPFAPPRPNNVLVADNSSLLAIIGADVEWRELAPDIRRRAFRERFAAPASTAEVPLSVELV